MNTIVSKVTIDLLKPAKTPVIHAVQGERNVRSVEVTLLADGTPWNIPENTLLTVRYGRSTLSGGYYDTLPDGTAACSYDGNVITVLLTPQMMTEAGAVLTQIEMQHEDQLLSTFSFRLMVELNPAVGILQPETYVNWLNWMKDQLDKMVEDGDCVGPAGPQGAAAVLLSTSVEYQAGESGSIIPANSWSVEIPDVPQGKYLWTRITNTFNTGEPAVSYSVARMGLDGYGSVSSVSGISPDDNGNVPLTAAHIGALSTDGGNMFGPVLMNGQTISGLSDPAESTQAATKSYVDKKDWFGIGTSIPANSDLNDYKTVGKYYQTGAVATLKNCPTTYNMVLYVLTRTTSNVRTQLIIDYYGNMYIRGNNGSNWRDWVKYTVQTDIDTAVENLRDDLEGAVKKATPVNLLDNSDFTELIAQAGILGNHGTSVYFADRWKIGSAAPSYNAAGRKITFAPEGTSIIRQKVAGRISGKTVTLAIKASNVSGLVNISESGAQSGHADIQVENGITTHTFVAEDNMYVMIWSGSGASLTIDWMALYEGEYTKSTLPEYRRKGYGAELTECLRYFHVYTNENIRPLSGTDCAPPMRVASPTQGTVTVEETVYYYNSADL